MPTDDWYCKWMRHVMILEESLSDIDVDAVKGCVHHYRSFYIVLYMAWKNKQCQSVQLFSMHTFSSL